MSQCDRFDGLDSTDEQDSIAGLLDTTSGCAQVGLKRKLKRRLTEHQRKLVTVTCIVLSSNAAYLYVIADVMKACKS